MSDVTPSPADVVRPLLRVRQMREFTSDPVAPEQLDAITDAARWSGSSANEQPWRFIAIRDPGTLRELARAGGSNTRGLATATAAVAVTLPNERDRAVSRSFDEGRSVERMLIAASLLGLGAGISWIVPDARDEVRAILGLPTDRLVRTIVALGHPAEAALRPKSAPGTARLPRGETVFEERWPQD